MEEGEGVSSAQKHMTNPTEESLDLQGIGDKKLANNPKYRKAKNS